MMIHQLATMLHTNSGCETENRRDKMQRFSQYCTRGEGDQRTIVRKTVVASKMVYYRLSEISVISVGVALL